MKTTHIIMLSVILTLVLISSTCVGSKPDGKTRQEYTSLDSIWLPYAKAMDSKNVEFLINNSPDSVTCYDCIIDSANQQVYFDTEFIFKNHLDKIMHLPTLTDRYFSAYQNDNSITIVYNVKSFYAPGGAYGLIFTLIKRGEKYYFQGMMVQ